MRYRLRTLLIVLAVGPVVLAAPVLAVRVFASLDSEAQQQMVSLSGAATVMLALLIGVVILHGITRHF